MYTRSVSSFFVAISASQIPIRCQRAAHRAASGPFSQSECLPGRDGFTTFLTQFPAPCRFKVKLCMYTVESQQGLLLLGITLATEALLACGMLESFIAYHSFHNCDVLSLWVKQLLVPLPETSAPGMQCRPWDLGKLSYILWRSLFLREFHAIIYYCFCSYRRKQMLCNITHNFNSSAHWQRLEIVAEITWKAAS